MIDKLLAYLRVFASKSDFKFVLEKAALYMKDLDQQCEDDRMQCTVRPMCEKRRWLSLLIKAGVKDIPQYCYSCQLKIFESRINHERYFYEPEDCAIYLDDFFLQVAKKSPSSLVHRLEDEEYDEVSWEIASFFRTKFNKVMSYDIGESLVLMVDGVLWYFDYIDNYVILNLREERVPNQETLLGLLRMLNNYYRLNIKVYEDRPVAWILDHSLFKIEDMAMTEDGSLKEILTEQIAELASRLRRHGEIKFKIEDGVAHLLVGINAFTGIPGSLYTIEPVTYGEIRDTYAAIRGVANNVETWLKERANTGAESNREEST